MLSRTGFSRLSLLLLSLLSMPLSVMAEEHRTNTTLVEFRLPASNLADALHRYSRQAGVTLSFDEQRVRGFSVPALSGRYGVKEMLFTLLQGTDLQAVPVAPGAWMIEGRSDDDLTVLDAIQVQSRNRATKDQIYREAASVNVITREQIERFRGTSVGDIFQGTPGVLISENRNSGGLDVNIRGMQGQGRVPVVVDGSRQETTVYRGYSGVSSRSYIDPDLIGSMRIDKGPVMSAEGTGATGGVVNVSTLNAEDVVRDGELSGVRLRVTGIGNNSSAPDAGTPSGLYLPRRVYYSDCRIEMRPCNDHPMPDSFVPDQGMDRPGLLEFGGYAFSLAGAQRYEWGDLVAAYATRHQGNYYAGTVGDTPKLTIGEPLQVAFKKEIPVEWQGASVFRGGERIANTSFSSESLLLKSNLMLPRDQSLELGYLRYDSDYGEMMPSQLRGTFGQARQWLNSEVLNHTYTARYRWQPVEYDWADLRINAWHSDATTELNTPGVGSNSIANNTHRTDDYQRWGLDISNTMRFFPLGEIRLDYGAALQLEDMDTDTPVTGGFYSGSRHGWRNELSVFTAASWQPTPQWKLELGLRHSRFVSRDNNPLPLHVSDPACEDDGNGGCVPVKYENSQAGSAPLYALTWEPLQGLQFYYRWAEALRMPSLFEGTSGFSVSPALDIPMNPEHTTNKEVGINYLDDNAFGYGHQLRFKLAYFRNHTAGYLTRTIPNAWEQKQNNLNVFRLRNIDSLDLQGFEVNAAYDTRSWLVEVSATRYRHIEICNEGSFVRYYCTDWGLENSYANNMIPPTWHGSVHLGGRLLQQTLQLGVRATLVGERNDVPDNNASEGFLSVVDWHSYRVFDLYAEYQINKDTSLDFTIDNLTDRYYLDALSLGEVPSPGRTVKLSLTKQF